ncbi:uncharacterized protein [Amphiura filiformis]|uniref:uncharacterized protein n=1 Tax=Amphiura filiformis TaxID=82378 RepID=UPI003B21BE5D
MTRREEFETENELMWNQLELQGRHSLLIGTGYKHKHDNVKFVTDLEVSLDKIEKKGKGYNIILAGDFNQANIDWKNSTVIRDHPASKSTAELLLETTTGFGLNQHVLEPTRKDSILDLVFTNNSSLVRDVKVDPGLSDHYMVITDIDLRAKWKRQPRRKYFVRRKANEDLINEELSTFKDKYFSMGNVSVQEKWDNLESEIKTVMNKHIPQRQLLNQTVCHGLRDHTTDSDAGSRGLLTRRKSRKSFGTRGFSAHGSSRLLKAFDKVPHERLLNKLHHYGIRNNLHQWIRSFLSNRTQRVACEGNFSSPKEVLSGVPQGTVLGPLLFLTYINDLPDMLSNQVRLFADDCLVYSTVSNERDMDSLQADLKSLETWQETWKMSFNPSKCTVMEISLKRNPPHRDYIFCGQVLQQPNSNPYLGVQLDNKLNWGEHVTNTVNKANRTLGFLRRNLWFCPGEVKSTAYLTFVRPVLGDAAGAWDPYRAGLIKKIESVQRKAARFCTGGYQRESSVTQMLEDLGWDTLAVRRERNRLAMFYKIQNELVGINKEAYIQTSSAAGLRRNHHLHVEIPFIKKDVYKNSFFPRTGRAWNSLTQTTISAPSLDIFKKNL